VEGRGRGKERLKIEGRRKIAELMLIFIFENVLSNYKIIFI